MAWLNRKRERRKSYNRIASVVTHVITRRLQFHSKHCSTEKSMQIRFIRYIIFLGTFYKVRMLPIKICMYVYFQ